MAKKKSKKVEVVELNNVVEIGEVFYRGVLPPSLDSSLVEELVAKDDEITAEKESRK